MQRQKEKGGEKQRKRTEQAENGGMRQANENQLKIDDEDKKRGRDSGL